MSKELTKPSATEIADDTVDWPTVVAEARAAYEPHDLAGHELAIKAKMGLAAAHVFIVGEYLLEKKRELAHGEFGPWLESQGRSERTARKYMAIARNVQRWTRQNGTRVPFSTLIALTRTMATSRKAPPKPKPVEPAARVAIPAVDCTDEDVRVDGEAPVAPHEAHPDDEPVVDTPKPSAKGQDAAEMPAPVEDIFTECLGLPPDNEAPKSSSNEGPEPDGDEGPTPDPDASPLVEEHGSDLLTVVVSLADVLEDTRFPIESISEMDLDALRELATKANRLSHALGAAQEKVAQVKDAMKARWRLLKLAEASEAQETGS